MNTTGNTTGDFTHRINSPLPKTDIAEQIRPSDLKITSSVVVSQIAQNSLKESADLFETTNSHALDVSAAEIGDFSDLSSEELAALIEQMEAEDEKLGASEDGLIEITKEISQSSTEIDQEEQSKLNEMSKIKKIATAEEKAALDEDDLSEKTLSQFQTIEVEEDTQLRRVVSNKELEASSKEFEALSEEQQTAYLEKAGELQKQLVSEHGDKNIIFEKKFIKIKEYFKGLEEPTKENAQKLFKLFAEIEARGHFDVDAKNKVIYVEPDRLGQTVKLNINGKQKNYILEVGAKIPHVVNGKVKYFKVQAMSAEAANNFKASFAKYVDEMQELHASYGITPTKTNEVVEEHKEEHNQTDEQEHAHFREHGLYANDVTKRDTQDPHKVTQRVHILDEVGLSSAVIAQKLYAEIAKQLKLESDKLIKFIKAELKKEENKAEDIKKSTIRQENISQEILNAKHIAETLEEINEQLGLALKQGFDSPQILVFREQYKQFRKMYTVCTQNANDPTADKQIIDKSYSELVSKALVMAEGVNSMIGQARAISVQQPTGGGA